MKFGAHSGGLPPFLKKTNPGVTTLVKNVGKDPGSERGFRAMGPSQCSSDARRLEHPWSTIPHSSLGHMLQDREDSLDLMLTLLDCVVERVGGGQTGVKMS